MGRHVRHHLPDPVIANPRREVVAPAALLVAATAMLLWWLGGPAATAQTDPLTRGRELFISGCASCHGSDGHGVARSDGEARGPSLVTAGAAGAYFQLSTGRMPAATTSSQAERKPPAYSEADIDALVAYVASLGDGPALPAVDPAKGELAGGGELFRANCAACHSASGAGGALSYGQYAPGLHEATPLQVGAALRSGPGQMPKFGADTFDDQQVDDIARYVQYLQHPNDRGGLPIGRIGPVPEGFVAWTLGMGALLAAVAWIGTRSPARRARRTASSTKERDG
jgi:ubiquinol-cytochrome c reductase cytochrome c subunit